MSGDNFATVTCFNDDTARWMKIRVPVAVSGQRPSEEAINAELRKRGLEMGRRIEIQAGVDYLCMTETLDERRERLKKRRRRLLKRELDIDLAGWRKRARNDHTD